MEDLKLLLFKETKRHLEQYRKMEKLLKDSDMLLERDHAKFCALYSLIEDAGLVEEYEAWKQAQEGEETE